MMLFLPVFRFVLYSTILGSVISIVILLLRMTLKEKIGVRLGYCLWLLLIIKLIIPYGPQSQLSVFNIVHLSYSNRSNINYVSSTNIKNYVTNKIHSYGEEKYKVPAENVKLSKNNMEGVKVKSVSSKNYEYMALKIAYFIWLIGVIGLVAFTIIKTLNFCFKLKKQEVCKDEKVIKVLQECKEKIGLKSNVIVLSNNILKNPAIFGFIRPRVLLPKGICNKVNGDELRYIILHELAHLKRKDTSISCIVCVLQIIHWFNPILWYAFYKMRQDREIACDALALSYMNSDDYTNYGYTIIKLLENCQKSNGIYGVQCMINDKHGLKRRITMISLFKKSSYKWSLISLVILVLIGVMTLTNSKKNVVVASNKKEQQLNNVASISEYDVKGKNFNGKMLVIPNSKKIVLGFDKESPSKISKTTSEIAKENNAICAINAGPFTWEVNDKTKIKHCGILIHNGEVIYNQDKDGENQNRDIVGFDDKGKLIVGKYTLKELKNINIKEAVSFGPALIVDGKPVKMSGDGGWGIAPRTAIGQRKDGSVLLLTINGRKIESMGATIKDLQDILKQYGAVNASNLDGGICSTMYYKGKIINKPCTDKESVVSATFMVLSK